MTFKVGDHAVHSQHGVGEVTSIEPREFAGRRNEFYILRTLNENPTTVYVPVGSALRLLRPIMSRKDAKKVLEVLKEDEEVTPRSQPWNRRQREYTELLNSGSPFEVAKVLRDLMRLRGDKEQGLSYGERQIFDRAKSLLVTELALARRCKESRVENDIANILGSIAS